MPYIAIQPCLYQFSSLSQDERCFILWCLWASAVISYRNIFFHFASFIENQWTTILDKPVTYLKSYKSKRWSSTIGIGFRIGDKRKFQWNRNHQPYIGHRRLIECYWFQSKNKIWLKASEKAWLVIIGKSRFIVNGTLNFLNATIRAGW